MKVLIGCERSGVVRSAFRRLGHEAYSCDVVPADDGGEHIAGDVLTVLDEGWDLAIFHPPCTHLATSGSQWFKGKAKEQVEALMFVRALLEAPIPRIALENPISIISTHVRKPDQIVQPWWFGDSFSKRTCLWLKNLPKLEKTNVVEPGEFVTFKSGKRMPKWYNISGKDRAKIRSQTFPGFAEAMASQWGSLTQ